MASLKPAFFLLALWFAGCQSSGQNTSSSKNIRVMKITSAVFKEGELIPNIYTCKGKNINPPVQIADVPAGTRSLALILDDPDAPGGTWVHWVMWNISPATGGIEENSVPTGAVQGKNSWGNSGYGGPCPPSGVHRYFFKIYALNTALSLPSSDGKKDLEKAMKGHILAEGQLMGRVKK